MATYYLWKRTNKKRYIAIIFSIILTPFFLLFDILCPFMLIGNVMLLGYIIFEIINGRRTLKTITREIEEGE